MGPLKMAPELSECAVQAVPVSIPAVSVPAHALPLERADISPPTLQPAKQEEMPAVTPTSSLQMVQPSSNHESLGTARIRTMMN